MKTLLLISVFAIAICIKPRAQQWKPIEQAKGLDKGDKAPLFTALTSDSTKFSLAAELQKRTVVLLFYRGFWCPVCSRHLREVQDSLAMLQAKNVTVIAVSPEEPEYMVKTRAKTGATFTLVYDEGSKIASSFDVSYTTTSMQRMGYNTLGARLDNSTEVKAQLPIPATYIIDKSGTIVWRQFNPDYKIRASVKEILDVVGKMNR